jgi:hypothetical protein
MNKYRVDRADSLRTPAGMNSILYIGESFEEARKVYTYHEPGKDAWNQPNRAYGVLLSVWSANLNDYIVKCSKGLY